MSKEEKSEIVVKNDSTTIDKHTYSALKNSLYPGSKDESIKMVLSYCKARNLDPLQKPVHIVPMYIKDSETGKGEMRDIIMPGIGLNRIQAQRSGCYAGQSDPEFGEEVTETLNGVPITYPKWCKITISKMMPNGQIVEFSSKEFWKENYATAGKDTTSPNAMWKKRPYGQLAKCTEAQALRKAFPDILDQSPTAEEMEGKHFEMASMKNEITNFVSDHIATLISKKNEMVDEKINNSTGEIEKISLFEQVKKQLENSKSIDTLNIAADLIRECPDGNQAELKKIFDTRKKEVE